ncbi:MAG: family 10 glycosylhydrolase [Acaryochloridaceae cyanobacterium RL_2_7]|nr:family 10 glycosylhydrolase [Acaryochloridaceae cyanobacterium RL_2_7]
MTYSKLYDRLRQLRRQWKIAAVVTLSLLLLMGQVPMTQAQIKPEIRGVWLTNVDSEVLFSKENLEAGLDQVVDLNLNTVYPTVWNWGYTLYPSAVAESTFGVRQGLYPDLEPQGRNEALEKEQLNRDMLQELITLAHERGLAVMPWMEFGFMAPADSRLVQQHSDWVTQRADGSQIKMEGSHPRVWLNPFHPGVRQFLIDLTLEIVKRYEIEGIQYDDHLGLPVAYGYDPYTVELYKSQHDGIAPPQDESDLEWMQWRADLISEWVADLFTAIKAENPKVTVSLSPNPAQWAYDTFLQDWVKWERAGWIEELVVQVYRDNMRRFRYELSQPELKAARDHIPVAIGVLSGLKARPMPVSMIRRQVNQSRDRNYAGISFFFYESLFVPEKEPLDERMETLQRLFTHTVPRVTLHHIQAQE